MEFFKLFVCIITVFTPHFLSPFQASSLQGWSENVLGYPPLGLILPGLEWGIFLNLKKTVFIIDSWLLKFSSQYLALPRVSFATFLQVCNFITKRLQNRCFLWNLCVFCEIFKNSFFYEHVCWLLLDIILVSKLVCDFLWLKVFNILSWNQTRIQGIFLFWYIF